MRLPAVAAAVLALVAVDTARAQCGPFVVCDKHVYLPSVSQGLPSPTPQPTATRTPVPIPPTDVPWARYSATDVIETWRAAGLEVGPVTRQTEDRPTACDWWTVELPSLPDGAGGFVVACETPELLTETRDWFQWLCDVFGDEYCPWRFERANVFVSFCNCLPAARMTQYRDVFMRMP